MTRPIAETSAQRFMDLFRGRTDEYGLRNIETGASWYEGARDGMGEIIYDQEGRRVAPSGLTLEDYKNHLGCKTAVALAIIPNTRSGNVSFGCLDIDKDDIDHLELVRRIKAFGLPLHVFISRSGAAHVYIFFDGDGKPANVVRKMLLEYSYALGCGKDLPNAEIFPNQDEFDESVLGHHITIPLYHSQDLDDRRGKFVDSNGNLHGLEGFLERVEVWPSQRKMPYPVRGESFEQGPPCLETIQRQGGIQAGFRNNGLYNVGVYLKKAYPTDWEERLEAFNRLYMQESVDDKELKNIVKSIKKKDYKYTCSKDPIASHCEKTVCEKRLFGIRSNEQKLIDEAMSIHLPIKGLIKYNTEPPTWMMMVGDVPVRLCTKQMMTYSILRESLLEAMNILPPTMKQQHWDIKLDDLLKNHTEFKDVSEDSSEWKLALDIINDFVRNARPKREAAINDCWGQWDKVHMGSFCHATTTTIRARLEAFNIKFTVPQLTVLLKQSGWNSVTIRMDSSRTLRVWKCWVPGLCPTNQDPKEGEVIDVEDDSGSTTADIHESSAEHDAG